MGVKRKYTCPECNKEMYEDLWLEGTDVNERGGGELLPSDYLICPLCGGEVWVSHLMPEVLGNLIKRRGASKKYITFCTSPDNSFDALNSAIKTLGVADRYLDISADGKTYILVPDTMYQQDPSEYNKILGAMEACEIYGGMPGQPIDREYVDAPFEVVTETVNSIVISLSGDLLDTFE